MVKEYLNTRKGLLNQLSRLKTSRTAQLRRIGVVGQNRAKAQKYSELLAERRALDKLTEQVKNRQIRSEHTLNKRLDSVRENLRVNRIQQAELLESIHSRGTSAREAAIKGTFLRSINDEWRRSKEWTTHSINNAEYLLIKATQQSTTINELYEEWFTQSESAIQEIDDELGGMVFDDAEQEYFSLTGVYVYI